MALAFQSGKQEFPPRLFVYGEQGIGKSSFGNSAPRPVFIDIEKGLRRIDCLGRIDCSQSYDAVNAGLDQLRTEEHDFETVVVDTFDWLERLTHKAICQKYGKKTMAEAAGGYGKAFDEAVVWIEATLGRLEVLNEQRGMCVIILAHAHTKKRDDPLVDTPYERWVPRLHDKVYALINEWSDAVLFATLRTIVKQTDNGSARAATIGANGGDRILRCLPGPAAVAKNRFDLPETIPLSWEVFANLAFK